VSQPFSAIRNAAHAVTQSWSRDIPSHTYALLRIALGLVGLLGMLGLTPVDMYWPLDGITPLSGDGPRSWLYSHGWGTAAGWAFFVALTVVFTAMTVGFRSNTAVICAFIGLVGQVHWNRLPLSSAHQVMVVLIFCLVWTDAGAVLSLDRRLGHRAAPVPPKAQPMWPLQLMRCQIALIYGSSGLHKLSFPMWRDGSAVHWAINLNEFHRLPWVIPETAAWFVALLTWSTLAFELAFPLLVLFRRTRALTLVAGIGLHLGLWATMELGPFSAVMIASYLVFLEPETVAKLFYEAGKSLPLTVQTPLSEDI
jgi:hypothetical protein